MRRRTLAAFTIVELLVVIAIIGVLVALLLPAIQAARESSRNAQCVNQLKQLANGCLQHEQAQGFLPTGGWGYQYVGDPTQGFGPNQPGGWMFNILPYIDQQNLHDLGLGGSASASPTQQRQGRAATMVTPLPAVNCPSRRGPTAPGATLPGYPFVPNTITFAASGAGNVGAWWQPGSNQSYYINANIQDYISGTSQNIARSDYVANGGSVCNSCLGATSGANPMYPGPPAGATTWQAPGGAGDFDGTTAGYIDDGVMYLHSRVQMAQIKDGPSKTYLIGEKYLNPDAYYNGSSCGDGGGWDMGFDFNTTRWVTVYPVNGMTAPTATAASTSVQILNQNITPPLRDMPGMDISNAPTTVISTTSPTMVTLKSSACDTNFGSPHTMTFNMGFCDGSVHSIAFSIDLMTHAALGGRSDHIGIDPSKWSP